MLYRNRTDSYYVMSIEEYVLVVSSLKKISEWTVSVSSVLVQGDPLIVMARARVYVKRQFIETKTCYIRSDVCFLKNIRINSLLVDLYVQIYYYVFVN